MDTKGQYAVDCQREQAIERLADAVKEAVDEYFIGPAQGEVSTVRFHMHKLRAAFAEYERTK